MGDLRRKIVGKVPGVGWREEQLQALRKRFDEVKGEYESLQGRLEEAYDAISQLESEISQLRITEDQLREQERHERLRRREPSFEALLAGYAGLHRAALRLGDRNLSAMAQIPYKLRNYSLANSHGVSAPRIYGVWSHTREINLEVVTADKVVLKGDGGHSAQGVLPLIRTDEGWKSVDGAVQFAGDAVPEDTLRDLAKARAPFFAEEFLESPSGWAIPEDVKLYCSYGEVMQVYVMRSARDGNMDRRKFTSRFFTPKGEPFGEIRSGLIYDPSIDPPEQLPELVEAASHLSKAVGLPFVRVDMYATASGPVLGELTSVPSGGKQSYVEGHDKFLGDKWVAAQARLERDLMLGRPYGTLYGDGDYTWWYPAAKDPKNMHHPDNWTRQEVACDQWCINADEELHA